MVTVSTFQGRVELTITNGLNVQDERTNAPRREWMTGEETLALAIELLKWASYVIEKENANIKRNLVG